MLSVLSPLCLKMVEVTCGIDDNCITLTVRCSTKDKPLVIGKSGSTANAVRQLLTVWGRRNGVMVRYSVL